MITNLETHSEAAGDYRHHQACMAEWRGYLTCSQRCGGLRDVFLTDVDSWMASGKLFNFSEPDTTCSV